VIDLINNNREGIEGISLCGGEPFAQAEPLSRVAAAAHTMGLSVVSFSGYTLEELASVPQADLLLAQTDILLDGRFEKGSLERKRHWVGSTNQRVHYLTARYAPGLEYPAEGERVRNSHTGPHGRVEKICYSPIAQSGSVSV
jgi:anaerobic ribonucleoside-triphosphate reductase activating protein